MSSSVVVVHAAAAAVHSSALVKFDNEDTGTGTGTGSITRTLHSSSPLTPTYATTGCLSSFSFSSSSFNFRLDFLDQLIIF